MTGQFATSPSVLPAIFRVHGVARGNGKVQCTTIGKFHRESEREGGRWSVHESGVCVCGEGRGGARVCARARACVCVCV